MRKLCPPLHAPRGSQSCHICLRRLQAGHSESGCQDITLRKDSGVGEEPGQERQAKQVPKSCGVEGILLRHVKKLPGFLRGLGAEGCGRGVVLQPEKLVLVVKTQGDGG